MLKPLLTIVGVIGTGVLLSACGNEGSPSMAPIGDGLRFLGICAVVAVLVAVLSTALRGGGPHG